MKRLDLYIAFAACAGLALGFFAEGGFCAYCTYLVATDPQEPRTDVKAVLGTLFSVISLMCVLLGGGFLGLARTHLRRARR